jgi:hypothetical protein
MIIKKIHSNNQDEKKCEDSETELFTYLTFCLLPNISVDVGHEVALNCGYAPRRTSWRVRGIPRSPRQLCGNGTTWPPPTASLLPLHFNCPNTPYNAI